MTSSHLIPKRVLGPSVVLESVGLQEGKLTILHDVNGTFIAGQWHGILGPNGGGKSTLLKTVLGLKNHHGKVTIHWPQDEDADEPKAGTIGYLPQLSPFDSSLPISVRDYLLMSLSTKPVWFKRSLPKNVLIALEEIRLDGKLERRLGDLSGGERQRLMLCTALLKKPSLLILDEPMTGLDKQGQDDCLSILSKFHKAGGTLIMVEHDWEVVEAHCEQIHWIDGTIQSQYSNEEFFAQQIQHPRQPMPNHLISKRAI